MKNVVALMGSPRKTKNTDIALNFVLNSMEEEYQIKKVYLKDLIINPCTGCDYCGYKEACILNDDMNMLYEGFDNADVVILAAPIYFNSFNGLTKNMIDRCQKYWSLKYSHGKDYKRNMDRKGICICVGGAPFDFNQFTGINPVSEFFFKSLNVEHIGNYFISNTDRESVETRDIVKNELELIGRKLGILESFHIQR